MTSDKHEVEPLSPELMSEEAEAIAASLKSFFPEMDRIELAEGFVVISFSDGMYATVDGCGVELRFDVAMGSFMQVCLDQHSNPEPDAVIRGITEIVQTAPALIAMGYERHGWGVDELEYSIQFAKKVDTSDLEAVSIEIKRLIDFFADNGGTA